MGENEEKKTKKTRSTSVKKTIKNTNKKTADEGLKQAKTYAQSKPVFVAAKKDHKFIIVDTAPELENSNEKKIILCMKGIEESSGKRLTEIFKELFPNNSSIAIWVGPGHVKSLVGGMPTCMVIDSENYDFKLELCGILSSNLIKCFVGNDLIGNEIGAACKNVLGIAAGILDAFNMESLKGPLMSLGAFEISKLIEAQGGKKESAFGLCHLGDFQATLFSEESRNRKFGESIVRNEKIDFIAEGMGTSAAVYRISKKKSIDLPICSEIYKIVHKGKNPRDSIDYLFSL